MKVAEQLVGYKQYTKRDGGATITLERLALSPNLKPTSNHWGLQVGGAGLVALALKGDPGVDDALMTKYLEGVEKNAIAGLSRGWGDGGYFFEHSGPGWIGSSWTFLPFLQAEKVANGKDWLTPRRNASWLTMKFAAQIMPTAKGPFYPNPSPNGGYGTEEVVQNGGHHAGYFSEGFGTVRPDQAPALLWVYNHFVQPTESARYPDTVKADEQSYDAFHPLRSVLTFVNWPVDMKEQNPAEIIPRVTCDTYYGQYIFRNRWQDENDIEVAVLFGARTSDKANRVMVWGLGQRTTFGKLAPSVIDSAKGNANVSLFTPAEDGSGIVAGGGTCIAVDYSKASGADAIVAMAGPGAAPGKSNGKLKAYSLTLPSGKVELLVLAADAQPEPKVDGDKIAIGGQSISYDGKAFKLGVMAGAPKLKQ